MTHMAAADTSALIARRTAAGLAALSAALHGVMLGHAGSVAAAVLIELWQSGTTRAWCLVALMNLAMVAVHLPISGSHHITHADVGAVVPQSMIMTVATVLSMVEALIAVAVLCYRTRGNARVAGRTE